MRSWKWVLQSMTVQDLIGCCWYWRLEEVILFQFQVLRQVQLCLRLFNVTMNRCYQLICEEDTAVSSFNRVNKFVWVGEQGQRDHVMWEWFQESSSGRLTKRCESSLRANVSNHGHTQYLIVEIFLKRVDHMRFLSHRVINTWYLIPDSGIMY